MLLICCSLACRNKPAMELLSSAQTGINFNNRIAETDSINVLDFSNIYNGGGVGVGDFNNDGLQDIYFTGNMVSNKLYLNEGDFKFKDVTDISKVSGNSMWCRGVAVVDINNDGWLDLYICTTIWKDAERRKNLLYVNQGADKNGVPYFKEMAKEYGLDDTSYTTMAAFFDYDNDGDLDVFLTVNEIISGQYPNMFKPIVKDGSFPSTSRLYRNDWNDSLRHPVFSNVSKQAGILIEGYGHGASVTDINDDGWKDIYVTNDYLSSNNLYINNHDGTFTDKAKSYFKHTSANSMGQDIVDLNNDGLEDVIELDMNPKDNYRKKMMLNGNSYLTYQNSDYFGYQYQYVRNTLQMNQGFRVKGNDSVGDPIFSEIGFYSNIAETDWSWTPLVADFDNDGLRDIVITNGFPKDITDHDFVAFRNKAMFLSNKKLLLQQIPEVKISNYFFHNNGQMSFSDESESWGITKPSFSNGAVYADLDNDGDLDMVINNINDAAFVYRNNLEEANSGSGNYLNIKFDGGNLNKNGLGAKAELHYHHGQQQVYENTPYRGYLSSVEDIAHFGIKDAAFIDTVIVKWQSGKMQLLQHVKANQLLHVKEEDAALTYITNHLQFATNALFKDVTDSLNMDYLHEQNDFIDFNYQRLLPHKFSEYAPALAIGDMNGDGLDDIISAGSYLYSAREFLQQPNGKFLQKSLLTGKDTLDKNRTDEGVLLFDADGDGDPDLYIASGGFQAASNSAAYQDKLYINDGKGNFKEDTSALPVNHTSKFCVRAIDYDKDGDLDLFVSGRVDPGSYPKPVSSFIFRNDSKDGHIKFTDVTQSVAPALKNIGLVSDAIFTDFNNDGWPDLILVGEWMPVTFLENDKGVFKNVTSTSGVSNKTGWWNSIAAGDFDNDGDMDYIVGNLGRNSFFQASEKYPVSVLAKDFDNNGTYDAVLSMYLPVSQTDTAKKDFPVESRDDILRAIGGIRKRFPEYKTFAGATMDSLFTPREREGALHLQANYFSSALLRNDGNGRFTVIPLPAQAQFSVLDGITVDDYDGDGNPDVLISGNDYGTEPILGRYDALNGLLMKGDGKGNFRSLSIAASGVYLPGNAKALVSLQGKNDRLLVAGSQNKGPLKIFELKKNIKFIPLKPMDESAIIYYRDGKKQKREVGYGSSFLSQSGRFLTIDQNVVSVEIKNNTGETRRVNIQ